MEKELAYIWSHEHNAWWKPNSYGYTTDIREAGKYTVEEAEAICQYANIIVNGEIKEEWFYVKKYNIPTQV